MTKTLPFMRETPWLGPTSELLRSLTQIMESLYESGGCFPSSKYGHCHLILIGMRIDYHEYQRGKWSFQYPLVDRYLESLGRRKRAEILIEYLKAQGGLSIAALLKKCYERGIFKQTLELPRGMFHSWNTSHSISLGELPITLTQPQTHSLNSLIIISIIPLFDIWNVYPTPEGSPLVSTPTNEFRDVYAQNGLYSHISRYCHNEPHYHDASPTKSTSQYLIQRLNIYGENLNVRAEQCRSIAVDQQLTDAELGEAAFPISDLKIASLQSLGQIKIECKSSVHHCTSSTLSIFPGLIIYTQGSRN